MKGPGPPFKTLDYQPEQTTVHSRWTATTTDGKIDELCRELDEFPLGRKAAALIRSLRRENEALRARLMIAGLPRRAIDTRDRTAERVRSPEAA